MQHFIVSIFLAVDHYVFRATGDKNDIAVSECAGSLTRYNL